MPKLIPIWAGVECTVNRVGDSYPNQCEKNGHLTRIEDLQRFKELGIERIRYPFLWEMVAPNSIEEMDWSWTDARAQEMQRLNLVPIAGLLHHGSGPRYTSLIDPEFPEKFAFYARKFSERYPWISDYTPVNEPLTTARFSGLYGVWYPHHRTDESFLRALYNQVKGTVLAMKAIRETNPAARLIQTEDMGRAQGTNPVQYQVEFENERRWLSFDLLCGRVNEEHPLFHYLVERGLTSAELQWLIENPCPPDIIGLNHYLLSNRFLDHRLEYYPEPFHGGNGRDRYADVGAVDTTAAQLPTPESVFREAWERFHIPLAVTEIHLLGGREAQMRWVHEVAHAAQKLKDEGVDFKAITVWSLLGSYDWNSLCTVCNQFYESGVFDIRGPEPRPTALAQMIQSWASGEAYDHPLLLEEGWWKYREGVPFGPKQIITNRDFSKGSRRPLVITGANGTLGKAFARICQKRHIPFRALTRQDMEISNFESVKSVIEEINPWAVINTAGYVRVDQAEVEKDRCFRENVEGPKNLAEVCARKKIPFLHFSSDLVFDGSINQPYMENHPVSPLNVYGQSKVESEKNVLNLHPESLVVRTSSFFGPWDEYNFIYLLLKSLQQGNPFQVVSDVTVSPTYVPDLVELCLDLLIDRERGLLHLTNEGHLTWAELAKLAAQMATDDKSILEPHGWSQEHIVPVPVQSMNLSARRPQFSALKSERIQVLPNYENALQRYFKELEMPMNFSKELGVENHI